MSNQLTFETPNLASEIERLTPEQIDQLPFGVIGLDPAGTVRIYSKTEAQRSGRGTQAATKGKVFFTDVAPCMDNGYFKGLIDKARASGKLDVQFAFIGDHTDRAREIAVRVQAAKDGGTWIFHRTAGTA